MDNERALRTEAERKARELRSVLELIEQNIAQGRASIVYEAIKEEISANTLNNWLKDKEKAVKAYKSNALLRIRAKIPRPEDVKKYDSYRFALDELGLDSQSQAGLRSYDGSYVFFHRFGGVKINAIVINAKMAPSFATFIFRYRASGRKHDCDGLVILRGTTIFFLGLAKESMFFGVLSAVADPANDYMKGFAVFQDFNEGKTYRSNVVFVNSRHNLSIPEFEAINNHLDQEGVAAVN